MGHDDSYFKYAEECEKLRNKFRVARKATKADLKNFQYLDPDLKKGDSISLEPEYNTTAEAWRLFTEYYARLYLEQQKYLFYDKYKVANEQTLTAETQEIEKFIEYCNSLSLSDAVASYNREIGSTKGTKALTYLRLKCGFYENLEVEKYPNLSTTGLLETYVYGRYFLFYGYLKDKIAQLKGPTSQKQLNAPKNISEIITKRHKLNDYLGLLKSTTKPCIDDNYTFLNGKGVFVIWLNALSAKGALNYSFRNDLERATLLNNSFNGLNISADLFRKQNKRATNNYKKQFELEIAAIKQ